MPGVLDLAFSVIVAALALSVLILSILNGCFRRYFFVNLCVAVMLLCDGLRYATLYRYGYRSIEYFCCFYLTDALLVTVTYLLILSFFEVIFGDMFLRRYVRLTLLFLILLVGLMSNAMISRTLPHSYSRLVVEFLQNMYFAAVILTVLLWISLSYLGVEDRRTALLVAGLGVFASAEAANYAVQNLLPKNMFLALGPLLGKVHTLATIAKLGLWCYALSGAVERVPQREPAALPVELKGARIGVCQHLHPVLFRGRPAVLGAARLTEPAPLSAHPGGGSRAGGGSQPAGVPARAPPTGGLRRSILLRQAA